jgi:uncharacterized protein (TIGR03437 family)
MRNFISSLLLFVSVAGAQPFSEFFVSSDANYGLQDTIAPGSIFSVSISSSLGVLPIHENQGFPLRTSLDGVSVRVTVAGASGDAYILSTETVRFRAMLPSGTPVGDGEMTLTINGRTTGTRKIRVVPRQFSLYAQPPGEVWWPRTMALADVIAADGSRSRNMLTRAARPGDTLILSGTGMGAVAGNEWEGPLPGDRKPPDVEVRVGDKIAKIAYAGRADCCAGVDQIVIEVPAGIEGCFAPVWVGFGGGEQVDQLSVAIAAEGGACSDLPRDVVERPDAERALNIGFISLNSGHAVFGRAPYVVAPPGTCRLGGAPPGEIDFSFYDFNRDDAGPVLNVRTPHGPERWEWSPFGQEYAGPNFELGPTARS